MALAKSKVTGRKSKVVMKTDSDSKIGRLPREESRMNFRLASDLKQRVARAAALAGQDLTEFAVAALSEKADVIIERHDQMFLGSEEYNFFLDALADTNAAAPSERSRATAERYRQGRRKGVRYRLAD